MKLLEMQPNAEKSCKCKPGTCPKVREVRGCVAGLLPASSRAYVREENPNLGFGRVKLKIAKG